MKGFNSVTLYFILLFAGTLALFFMLVTIFLFHGCVLSKIRSLYFNATFGRSQNNSMRHVLTKSKKHMAGKTGKREKRTMITVVTTSTGKSSTDVEESMV